VREGVATREALAPGSVPVTFEELENAQRKRLEVLRQRLRVCYSRAASEAGISTSLSAPLGRKNRSVGFLIIQSPTR
jgi:hypothetical protein